MAKKERKKKKKIKKGSYYKVEENKLKRTKTPCPKCGAGVFLAEHKNRVSCGKCHYTEWKKEGN